MEGSEQAVNEVIANLNRIPKEIESAIIMKDLLRQLDQLLKKELRRRVSYTA